MRTVRRTLLTAAAAGLACLVLAPAAGASPTALVLPQGDAFAILGHSCGGIQEKAYATGFSAEGFPQGEVYLSTSCGGSGRGGGYKTTKYSAWATDTWDWYGDTRAYGRLEGPAEVDPGFSAEDSHGDRIYNTGTAAFLELGEAPPVQPPAPPSGVSASVGLWESGETEFLRMDVSWTLDPATAGLVTSTTVTATPTKPGPPVLTATNSGVLQPVEPNTTYRITVTASDREGTSEPSAPIEVTTPNSDGEAAEGGEGGAREVCEQNSGTIRLSPGLSETPHVQTITVKGELRGCDGPEEPQSGTYVAHLTTTEEVTCSALQSVSAEPTTSPTSLVVKWAPAGIGTSHGSLLLPVTEVPGVPLEGQLEGGPLQEPLSVAGTVSESFTGGPECGIPQGTKRAKPVKKGFFSGGAVELG